MNTKVSITQTRNSEWQHVASHNGFQAGAPILRHLLRCFLHPWCDALHGTYVETVLGP